MDSFKIDRKKHNKIKTKLILQLIILTFLNIILSIYLMYICDTQLGLPIASFGLLIFVLTIYFTAKISTSYRNRLNKHQSISDSFTIVISDEFIVSKQAYNTPISIPKTDVAEIIKNLDGSILIKPKNKPDLIYIPYSIEQSGKIESILNEIQPIQIIEQKHMYKLGIFILSIISPVIILASNFKISVYVSASLFLGIFILTIHRIYQNIHINIITRLLSYWLIIIIILVIMFSSFKLDTLIN